MSYFRLIMSLTAIILLALPVMADEDEGNWRTFDVSLFGGLSSPSGDMTDWDSPDGAKSGFHMGLNGTVYFTEAFGLGLQFNYTRWGMEGEFGSKFHIYDFGPFLKYAMVNESSFEPYARVSGGVVWPKFATEWEVEGSQNPIREQSYDPGFGVAGYLGVLWYTSDYGSLFIEAGYHNDFIDGVEASNYGMTRTIENNSQYIEVTAGITVFFGPEE